MDYISAFLGGRSDLCTDTDIAGPDKADAGRIVVLFGVPLALY